MVPIASAAQELVQDTQEIVKAKVFEVISEKSEPVAGTSVTHTIQKLRVEILEGIQRGEMVTFENDFIVLRAGDTFFLNHTTNTETGAEYYSVSEPYRLPTLFFFIGLFVLAVFLFGGKQGIRGLCALILSFLFIGYFLLPGISHGYSPALVSIGVSSLIIILGSYITHGYNWVTTSAVIGMVLTIVLTGLLAYGAIHFARLTGFANEEAVYLNFDTAGKIDFSGLLLGGILIGLLGVLYDAAIGQAVSVDELTRVASHLPKKTIYLRAMRIGREHIGALVNTLAIAYVGTALPLLLLSMSSSGGLLLTMNREIFATEIIRMMIGSIGLILAVPLTTIVSVRMLWGRGGMSSASDEHRGHRH